MLILSTIQSRLAGASRRQRNLLLPALLVAAAAPAAYAQTYAVPPLPTIGTDNFNPVLTAGTTSTIAAGNTTLINNDITAASAAGGGTIVIPTGNYDANEILLKNNVNLDVQTGATLTNFAVSSTFVSTAAGCTGNIEISGGGILNDNATSTKNSNKMVQLEGQTKVEINGVTIENASNEHLVTECCNNVTINAVTIQDPLGYLANTDGIDFSGTNYSISNCNIADGDDNLVAKPDTTVVNGITAYTANVLVQNINITAGHGISIGGQTNAGLNGMYVNNVTETGAGTDSSTRIEQGIHLKAGDGTTSNTENGGLVENVTFNNMTMTNVDDALVINSFYNSGDDNFPSTSSYPVSPTDSTEPLWKNITMENITVNNAVGSAAEIYGLDSTPANTIGINVLNVNVINSGSAWKMYYATGLYFNNVSVRGGTLPDSEGDFKNGSGVTIDDEEPNDIFVSAANASPIYTPALVPEPASITVLGAVGLLGLWRRRARRNT